MSAGPTKGSNARTPLRRPSSTSRAATSVRNVAPALRPSSAEGIYTARLEGHHAGAVPRQFRQRFRADVQVLHDEPWWRMSQPVGKRDLSVVIGFEEAQEH